MIAITEEIFVYSQIVSKYSILSITSLLYLKKTHDGRRERRRENWPSYRQNSSSITALENTTLEGRIRSSRGQTHTYGGGEQCAIEVRQWSRACCFWSSNKRGPSMPVNRLENSNEDVPRVYLGCLV